MLFLERHQSLNFYLFTYWIYSYYIVISINEIEEEDNPNFNQHQLPQTTPQIKPKKSRKFLGTNLNFSSSLLNKLFIRQSYLKKVFYHQKDVVFSKFCSQICVLKSWIFTVQMFAPKFKHTWESTF